MALTFRNRIREQTTKTGTGATYACGSNVTGFKSFSTLGNGAKCIVRVAKGADAMGADWEVFVGTYNSGANTITRNTLLSSSTGSAVNWTAGIKDMAIVPVAERQVAAGTGITVTDNETTGEQTVACTVTSWTQEQIEDFLAAAFTPGYDIEIEYDDTANTFTWHRLSNQHEIADGATITIDLDRDLGHVQDVTIDGDRDVEVANAVAGKFFDLRITQGTGGNHDLTYLFPVTWIEAGVQPKLTPVEGKSDLIHFFIESVDAYGVPTCRAWVETTERALPLATAVDAATAPAGDVQVIQESTPGTNEVQEITLVGSPTGGTFTLTFDGQTTSGIAYNASAGTVQTALEALSNIVPGDVTCGGGSLPGTPVTVTFGGNYIYTNVPQMTINPASLTGGTVAASVSTTTGGVSDTALNNAFVLFRGNGATAVFESQRISGDENVTGGTFTLTIDGRTTSAIPYNVRPLELQNIINAALSANPGKSYYCVAYFNDGPLNKVGGGTIDLLFAPDTVSNPSNIATMTINAGSLVGGTYSIVQQDNASGTSDALAGNYTLTVSGDTTSTISVSASNDDVLYELESLASVGSGNVTVTKLASHANINVEQGYLIEFIGSLANQAVSLTCDASGVSTGELTLTEIQAEETVSGTNEVQQLTTTGTPSQGTFTLTYDGQTTSALDFDATASEVDAALEALSNIGTGDVTCTGGPLPTAINIEFTGALAETDVSQITVNDDGLQAFATTTTQGSAAPANEIQEITITPDAGSGTYTLTYDGNTTDPISYDANAAAIETALELLAGLSDVTVTGGPLATDAVQVEFGGTLAGSDAELLTIDTALLLSAGSVVDLDWSICDFATITLNAGDGTYIIRHINLMPGKSLDVVVDNTAGATGTLDVTGDGITIEWGVAGAPDVPPAGESRTFRFRCVNLTLIEACRRWQDDGYTVIESRTDDPADPVPGRIWFRSDL